jgi:hypothetical protein
MKSEQQLHAETARLEAVTNETVTNLRAVDSTPCRCNEVLADPLMSWSKVWATIGDRVIHTESKDAASKVFSCRACGAHFKVSRTESSNWRAIPFLQAMKEESPNMASLEPKITQLRQQIAILQDNFLNDAFNAAKAAHDCGEWVNDLQLDKSQQEQNSERDEAHSHIAHLAHYFTFGPL